MALSSDVSKPLLYSPRCPSPARPTATSTPRSHARSLSQRQSSNRLNRRRDAPVLYPDADLPPYAQASQRSRLVPRTTQRLRTSRARPNDRNRRAAGRGLQGVCSRTRRDSQGFDIPDLPGHPFLARQVSVQDPRGGRVSAPRSSEASKCRTVLPRRPRPRAYRRRHLRTRASGAPFPAGAYRHQRQAASGHREPAGIPAEFRTGIGTESTAGPARFRS